MDSGIKSAVRRIKSGPRDLWEARSVIWRPIRGIILLFFTLLAPATVWIALGLAQARLERDTVGREIVDGAMEVTFLMFVTIVFSIFIVYFIRLLHFLQTTGREFWKQETAPFVREKNQRGDGHLDDPISHCRRKFVEWSILSFGIWLTFILTTITALAFIDYTGIEPPSGETLPTSFLRDVATKMPVFGDLFEFEFYIGNSTRGTLSYLFGAIPLAIAIRNLMFVFEYSGRFKEANKRGGYNLAVAITVALSGFFGMIILLLLAMGLDTVLGYV